MKSVYLPISLTHIGKDAFAPNEATIHCDINSYAYKYAIENGFNCEAYGIIKNEDIAKPCDEEQAEAKPNSNTQTNPILKTQKITVAKIKTYKAATLKKKAVKINLKAKTSGKGKLTYEVSKYPKGMKKFVAVNKKGVVTLKKKAKKGTYKIKIIAAAKGDYKKTTKTITIKVK